MLGMRAAKSELGLWLPDAVCKPVLKENEPDPEPRGGGSLPRGRDEGVAEKSCVGLKARCYRSPRTRTEPCQLLSRTLQRPGCSAPWFCGTPRNKPRAPGSCPSWQSSRPRTLAPGAQMKQSFDSAVELLWQAPRDRLKGNISSGTEGC